VFCIKRCSLVTTFQFFHMIMSLNFLDSLSLLIDVRHMWHFLLNMLSLVMPSCLSKCAPHCDPSTVKLAAPKVCLFCLHGVSFTSWCFSFSGCDSLCGREWANRNAASVTLLLTAVFMCSSLVALLVATGVSGSLPSGCITISHPFPLFHLGFHTINNDDVVA
jgi:hypothetical protein